jgi:hypothetical protein
MQRAFNFAYALLLLLHKQNQVSAMTSSSSSSSAAVPAADFIALPTEVADEHLGRQQKHG